MQCARLDEAPTFPTLTAPPQNLNQTKTSSLASPPALSLPASQRAFSIRRACISISHYAPASDNSSLILRPVELARLRDHNRAAKSSPRRASSALPGPEASAPPRHARSPSYRRLLLSTTRNVYNRIASHLEEKNHSPHPPRDARPQLHILSPFRRPMAGRP